MTVDYLLANISSQELAEWMAFYQLEPFGEERADLRMGILASVIANIWRGKGTKTFKPADFMPEFDKGKDKQQSEADMKSILLGIVDGNSR